MTRINFANGTALDRSKSFLSNIKGVAGIEAAFIFPVMLMIYFGLLDLTSVLSANRRVTQMASTLAERSRDCWTRPRDCSARPCISRA